jgi:hypothetical protein
MNGFFNMNPMFSVLQQVQQIKQNPSQLANLLKQRGMIDDKQFAEINKMGNDYEKIGHFLMQNGKMPTNVQQYQSQVEQIQNLMK